MFSYIKCCCLFFFSCCITRTNSWIHEVYDWIIHLRGIHTARRTAPRSAASNSKIETGAIRAAKYGALLLSIIRPYAPRTAWRVELAIVELLTVTTASVEPRNLSFVHDQMKMKDDKAFSGWLKSVSVSSLKLLCAALYSNECMYRRSSNSTIHL